MKLVVVGLNLMDLKCGIDLVIVKVVEVIKLVLCLVNDLVEVVQVGMILVNGEQFIGQQIVEVMQCVGNEGVIIVEENKGMEMEVEVVEGMQFDCGYLLFYFVINVDKMIVELEDVYILLYEKKFLLLQLMVLLLEVVIQL